MKARRNPESLERLDKLWCVHVIGPDDLIATPDRDTAVRIQHALEVHRDQDPPCWGEVIEWPYSPSGHAYRIRKGDWKECDPGAMT